MTHVVVDPVTRIEGHLRIEAEVDGGAVQNAWSSSTMFRGIETILKGRDPRDAWAFTQRICGVCTTVHAITSIRAVENAIGAEPPPNARLLRNLIMASQMVQDHVVTRRQPPGWHNRSPTGRCRALATSPVCGIVSNSLSSAAS
jgi:Ni,Fe-hydrogenase I large subunit